MLVRANEARIAVAGIGGNFLADPTGQFHRRVDFGEFDFGDHQPLVATAEDIDFPGELALRQGEALHEVHVVGHRLGQVGPAPEPVDALAVLGLYAVGLSCTGRDEVLSHSPDVPSRR